MEEEKDVLDELEVYLTPQDIQKHLGFGRVKTYQIISETGFPKIYFGKSIRIPQKDYQNWLNKQRKRGMFI